MTRARLDPTVPTDCAWLRGLVHGDAFVTDLHRLRTRVRVQNNWTREM